MEVRSGLIYFLSIIRGRCRGHESQFPGMEWVMGAFPQKLNFLVVQGYRLALPLIKHILHFFTHSTLQLISALEYAQQGLTQCP